MARRSPIRHHVRGHQRSTSDGKTTVHNYERGKGERKAQISKPKIRKPNQRLSSFLVRITYVGQQLDSVSVAASSYPEAIEQAMLSRLTLSPPAQVEVIKQ